jgi:hypothetical protein
MWLRIPMSPPPILPLTPKPYIINESINWCEKVGGSGKLWDIVVIKVDGYQYIRYKWIGLKGG